MAAGWSVGVLVGRVQGGCGGMVILFALAQRGKANGENVEPVVQVLAESALGETSILRSRWVAAMMRISTGRHESAPTGRN